MHKHKTKCKQNQIESVSVCMSYVHRVFNTVINQSLLTSSNLSA